MFERDVIFYTLNNKAFGQLCKLPKRLVALQGNVRIIGISLCVISAYIYFDNIEIQQLTNIHLMLLVT